MIASLAGKSPTLNEAGIASTRRRKVADFYTRWFGGKLASEYSAVEAEMSPDRAVLTKEYDDQVKASGDRKDNRADNEIDGEAAFKLYDELVKALKTLRGRPLERGTSLYRGALFPGYALKTSQPVPGRRSQARNPALCVGSRKPPTRSLSDSRALKTASKKGASALRFDELAALPTPGWRTPLSASKRGGSCTQRARSRPPCLLLRSAPVHPAAWRAPAKTGTHGPPPTRTQA